MARLTDRSPDPHPSLPRKRRKLARGHFARERRRRAGYPRLKAAGWGVARMSSIIALALAWELLARSGAFTPFMLPALSAVLERIWNDLNSGELLLNTAVTLYRALAGFLIGAVAGIALGMAISRNGVANWFFDPIISVGFPMPKIAFLPVVMLWLGVYDVSKITMVSVEAIFPVVTATIVGIRGVERELLWSARNMGAGERELLWQIAVPAALPQIITGLQVALPIALIVAIVTEMFMGGYGLGGAMNTASRFADSRGVFAGIVEIAAIGYALVKLMAIARRRLLLWHQEAQAPSTV
jgi:ABC-type nitrate/sulfonate/bicarbonate transport system permease component